MALNILQIIIIINFNIIINSFWIRNIHLVLWPATLWFSREMIRCVALGQGLFDLIQKENDEKVIF